MKPDGEVQVPALPSLWKIFLLFMPFVFIHISDARDSETPLPPVLSSSGVGDTLLATGHGFAQTNLLST